MTLVKSPFSVLKTLVIHKVPSGMDDVDMERQRVFNYQATYSRVTISQKRSRS